MILSPTFSSEGPGPPSLFFHKGSSVYALVGDGDGTACSFLFVPPFSSNGYLHTSGLVSTFTTRTPGPFFRLV